jgi:hypothetical protein
MGPYNQVTSVICIIHQKDVIIFSPIKPSVAVMWAILTLPIWEALG